VAALDSATWALASVACGDAPASAAVRGADCAAGAVAAAGAAGLSAGFPIFMMFSQQDAERATFST
jgi:hypothetical protein